MTLAEGYDIIAFGPRTELNPASIYEQKRKSANALEVLQGVLATRLEYDLIAERTDFPTLAPQPRAQILNATAVLQAAKVQGIKLLKLDSSPDAFKQLDALSFSPPIKAEIGRSLTAGYTIVVPERAVAVDGQAQIGWWRVASRSGEVIGMMPGARGASEYAQLISGVASLSISVNAFALCLYAIAGPTGKHVPLGQGVLCAIGATAAGIGTYGYWTHGAVVSGISAIIGMLAAYIAVMAQ